VTRLSGGNDGNVEDRDVEETKVSHEIMNPEGVNLFRRMK
jgi:hypothetical protein